MTEGLSHVYISEFKLNPIVVHKHRRRCPDVSSKKTKYLSEKTTFLVSCCQEIDLRAPLKKNSGFTICKMSFLADLQVE